MSGIGLQNLDLGICLGLWLRGWISEFGSQVLDLSLYVPGFGSQEFNLWVWVSGFEFLGLGFRICH